jgi:hypothetical protein
LRAFDPAAVAGRTRGGIDNVDFIDGLPGLVTHPQPTIVPHGAPVLVSGWTVDPATHDTPLAVCLLVDRVRPLEARIGIARGDIMQKEQTGEFVGFQTVVETTDLGTGPHELRSYALAADGYWYEAASVGFRVYRRAYPVKERLNQGLRMLLERTILIGPGTEVSPTTPIRANHWVCFQGWMLDSHSGGGAATVAAFDETGRMWSGPSNLERPDVRADQQAASDRLGFEVTIPAAVLEPGRHIIRITGHDEMGRSYANSIETAIDIIAAERPFPLVARALAAELRHAAQLRVTQLGIDGEPVTQATQTLPARDPIVKDDEAGLVIEGWALDQAGKAAEEVFVELAMAGVHIPPQRIAAECALREPVPALADSAPVGNAWFRFAFRTDELPPALYEIALVVVEPGRRSFARSVLAKLNLALLDDDT